MVVFARFACVRLISEQGSEEIFHTEKPEREQESINVFLFKEGEL